MKKIWRNKGTQVILLWIRRNAPLAMMFIFYIFILGVLGFEFRALPLQGNCFTDWAMPPALTGIILKST
jgi:hypothetical protein